VQSRGATCGAEGASIGRMAWSRGVASEQKDGEEFWTAAVVRTPFNSWSRLGFTGLVGYGGFVGHF
jgi:hypothetical protein